MESIIEFKEDTDHKLIEEIHTDIRYAVQTTDTRVKYGTKIEIYDELTFNDVSRIVKLIESYKMSDFVSDIRINVIG